MIVAGDPSAPRRSIAFPYSEVKRLIGVDIPRDEGEAILAPLGFGVEDGKVLVPSWRPDVQGKADVVEQIVRIAGLDRVPTTPLPRLDEGVPKPVLTLLQKRTRLAKRTLGCAGAARGGDLVVHLQGRGGAVRRRLAGARARQPDRRRPFRHAPEPRSGPRRRGRAQRAPGLARRRAVRGRADLSRRGENDQRIAAAAVRRGRAKADGEGRHWSGGGLVDVFDAKRDAMALLAALGVAPNAVQVVPGGPAFLHPGRSATLKFGPKNIVGWFGQLHPSACEALDAEGPIVAFEITLDAIPAPKAKPTKTKPKLERSDFMPVERDLAFVVGEAVGAADILKAAESAERALVANVDVFDVYHGQGLPEGAKSIAIPVTLQPRERTLTDAEIDAAVSKIVAEVSRKTGATLRS